MQRIARRCILPTLVIAPALAIGLCSPSVALAAETGGPDSASAGQPQVIYTEDVFSTNADFQQSTTAVPATESSQVSIGQEYDQGSSTAAVVVADGGGEYGASSDVAVVNCDDSNSYSESSYYQDGVNSEIEVVQSSEMPQEIIASANNSTRKAMSFGSTQSVNSGQVSAQDDSGSVTHYESHEASITFNAGEGGTIAPISNVGQAQNTSSYGKTITENYADSLTGASNGARAVADDGYHFVKWIDLNNGNTLSTSENFIPERPEEGWPYSWLIQAVFAPNVYQVRLDPNGGKTAGGGGSGGAITFDVAPGSGFQLPANGTDFTFAKVGSAFSGWNTASNPEGAGVSTPLAIDDAAIFDSDLEDWLQRLGWLKLDWSKGSNPVVTLYAQWVSGQSTITYKASEGGAISAKAPASSVDDSIATETINATNGMHLADSSVFGPQGATANASSRHHFVTWDVSGSKQSLADSEADSNVLSAGTATRIARYSEYSGVPEEYHPVTFTAQFAPNAYTFIYEGNGGNGSIASTDVTYGLSAQAAASGITRSGYKLSGWNLAASGSGTSIALGQTIDDALLDSLISAGLLSDANGARMTLYAQWDAESSPVQPEDPKPTPTPENGGKESGGSSSGGNGSGSGGGNSSGSGSQGGSSSSGSGAGGVINNATGDTGSGSSGEGSEEGTGEEGEGSSAIGPLFFADAPFYGYDTSEILSDGLAGTSEVSSNAVESSNAIVSVLAAATVPAGTLAASDRVASLESPIVIGSSITGVYGDGYGGDALTQLMGPEAAQAAGTTVATVATVGAIAGLVGVGVSVAGAALAGAAAIGTSSAVALSTAADLAADLAASAAGAGGAAAAARRRREEEEEAARHEA